MHRPLTLALEGLLRLRGHRRYSEPRELAASHFGPGGLEEAEARCEEANRDLLAFVRPPAEPPLEGFRLTGTPAPRHASSVRSFAFRSPLPSGCPHNDVVSCRLYLPEESAAPGSVIIFHHSMRQDSWEFWEGFLRALVTRVPVAVMAAPHHFERRRPGEFAGQRTCSSNPWELFQAIRQWSWDQQALRRALRERFGLKPRAIAGFSLGAFQTLLLAAAGGVPFPIVSMATTCRYAYGIRYGWVGANVRRQLAMVGIDGERLEHMTRSLQLQLHADRIDGDRVLFIEGLYDRVDPPPSLRLLREALRPRRSLCLPCGHGTMVLWRRPIADAMNAFFAEMGVLPARGAEDPVAMPTEETRGSSPGSLVSPASACPPVPRWRARRRTRSSASRRGP